MGISVPKLEIKYLLQTDFFYCINTNTKRDSDKSCVCDCTFSLQDYSKVLKNTLVDFYLKNFEVFTIFYTVGIRYTIFII